MLLAIVKSGLIAGGAGITLEDYEDNCNAFITIIVIGDKNQNLSTHGSSGPTEAKMFSIVLMKGTNKEYWFAKVVLLFPLNTTKK